MSRAARSWRRPRPRLALLLLALTTLVPLVAALAGGSVVGALVDDPVDTLLVAVAAGLVGAWLRWPPALAAATVGTVLLTTANQLAHPDRYTAANDLFFFAVLVGGPTLAGALVGARARQVRQLRALARVRAEQRDAEVRTARLEERNRIETAVTRSMVQRLGGLVVQASGARSGPATDEVREALGRIEESGRATLDDLRDTLGSLRAPDDEPAPLAEPTRPAPRLGPLDVLVACCGVPVAVEAVTGGAAHGPVPANLVAGVLVGVPLLVRRRHPIAAATASFAVAACMTAWLTPLPSTVAVLLPMSLTAYALGAHTRGRRRLLAAAVLPAGGAAVTLASPASDRDPDGILPTLIWVAVAFAAGVLAAQHADRAARLRRLLDEIEAGRGARLRLAVAEQRQAVARDLHDTVAHAMTVVCLHAEAAQRQWGADTVAGSLETIEATTREAMLRLRQGLLSLEAGDDVVCEVLRSAGSLGVPVEVSAAGLQRPLSPDEESVVLRVVREALVNAARHAPGAQVSVQLRADGHGLIVEARNGRVEPGPPAYALGSGTGLLGLSELVRQHGGRLDHGRTDDGFQVTAHLPSRSGVPA